MATNILRGEICYMHFILISNIRTMIKIFKHKAFFFIILLLQHKKLLYFFLKSQSFIIIFYQMQQTIKSINISTKLQKITRKVNKILAQKYKYQDSNASNQATSNDNNKSNLIAELKLDEEDIQLAYQKTQKMNTKLKLIRTMLGYQYESSQKKQKINSSEIQESKHSQEKGINLKQFVMSMRKRNELTDKYFKHRRVNSIDQNFVNFEPQNKNIQQYTDASLKYVHSFLPHHTMLQHSSSKSKKQYITLTPKYEKLDSPTSKDSKYSHTIQHSHVQSDHLEPITSIQNQKIVVFKNKRSLTLHNQNQTVTTTTKRSFNFVPQVMNDIISKFTQVQKQQSSILPSVQNESKRSEKDFKLISNTAPIDVCSNRATQLIYRGKNYYKQLKNTLRSNREPQKHVKSQEKQSKKSFNQLLPTIKQCIPQNRIHQIKS